MQILHAGRNFRLFLGFLNFKLPNDIWRFIVFSATWLVDLSAWNEVCPVRCFSIAKRENCSKLKIVPSSNKQRRQL